MTFAYDERKLTVFWVGRWLAPLIVHHPLYPKIIDPAPFNVAGQTDLQRLMGGSRFSVGPELSLGDYVLADRS